MWEVFPFFVELVNREREASKSLEKAFLYTDTRNILYIAQWCVNWQLDEDLTNSMFLSICLCLNCDRFNHNPLKNEQHALPGTSPSCPSVCPMVCWVMIGCVREWSDEKLWQFCGGVSSRLLVLAWGWRRVPKLLLRPRRDEAALVAPQLAHVIFRLLVMATVQH